MFYKNQIEISIPKLRKNIRTLLSLCKGQPLYPMVKTDAYGMGQTKIVSTLVEERILEVGVLRIQEAIHLNVFRNNGLRVLIFSPLFNEENIETLNQNENWIPVCSSIKELNLLQRYLKRPRPVHIKVNLGMERLGVDYSELDSFLSSLKSSSNIILEGVCGHLPIGSGAGDLSSLTQNHIKLFKKMSMKFEEIQPKIKKHLFNTSAVASCYANQIPIEFGLRVGGLLYGVKSPAFCKDELAQKRLRELPIEEISRIKSYIVSHKVVPKGQSISYDHLWKAPRDSNIAVVGFGYGDGFSKSLHNKIEVLFRNQKVPIVGSICMDYCFVDITSVLGLKPPQLGEEVSIGGDMLSIDEFAEKAGTIPYEIFTNFGHTFERKYI